jgi:hypothetical protein
MAWANGRGSLTHKCGLLHQESPMAKRTLALNPKPSTAKGTWAAATGALPGTFNGHIEEVTGVAFAAVEFGRDKRVPSARRDSNSRNQ